jgi:hypothetical protein
MTSSEREREWSLSAVIPCGLSILGFCRIKTVSPGPTTLAGKRLAG